MQDSASPADLALVGGRVCPMTSAARVLEDAVVVVGDGRIAWIGPRRDYERGPGARTAVELHGRCVTPGLVDCHTHLVHAGRRTAEFELKLEGVSYAEIAQRGGGIVSTVRATRAATLDALVATAERRARRALACGTTRLEIKSGYGLDLETERRMLQAARAVGERTGQAVHATFLGAHAVPPEYAGRADAYLDFVIDGMLAPLAAEGLVDSVDAFCEGIAFSPAQVRRVFEAARALGLPVRLHADQLSDTGGGALAAEYRALSADHLEYTDAAGVAALAAAGTVAVLLPGAFHYLRETRRPPVAALRAAGVPMAVATDCNPGSSPIGSLPVAMNLACLQFGLTPWEALAGVTCHAAQALGALHECGTLEPGKRADLAVWDVEDPVEIVERLGDETCAGTWLGGVRVESSGDRRASAAAAPS